MLWMPLIKVYWIFCIFLSFQNFIILKKINNIISLFIGNLVLCFQCEYLYSRNNMGLTEKTYFCWEKIDNQEESRHTHIFYIVHGGCIIHDDWIQFSCCINVPPHITMPQYSKTTRISRCIWRISVDFKFNIRDDKSISQNLYWIYIW